jgi:hypothetical protein
MSYRLRLSRRATLAAAAAAGLALATPSVALAGPAHHDGGHHHHDGNFTVNQVDLFSGLPGQAAQVDPRLINPWGLAFTSASGVWTSDQGKDVAGAVTLTPGQSTGAITGVINCWRLSVLWRALACMRERARQARAWRYPLPAGPGPRTAGPDWRNCQRQCPGLPDINRIL